MQLRNIFQISLQFLAILRVIALVSSITDDYQLLPRAPLQRNVYALFLLEPQAAVTTSEGRTLFPTHSALFIEGTDDDGPLRIEVRHALVGKDLEYRVLDYGVGNKGKPPPKYADMRNFLQGSTSMTNDNILNGETGDGPVKRALATDVQYRSGPDNAGKLNSCHNFNARIMNELGITTTEEIQGFFKDYDEISVKVNTESWTRKLTGIKLYNPTSDPSTPKIMKSWSLSDLGCSRRAKRSGTCSLTLVPEANPVDSPGQNELALNSNTKNLPADQLDITASDPLPEKSIPVTGLSEQDQVVKVGLVRSAGTLTSFRTLSKAALVALGAGGALAGTAFVILDFVDHNWVGAAIGAVSMVAGIAVSLALSGPVGWIVEGALAALFASKFVLPRSEVLHDANIN